MIPAATVTAPSAMHRHSTAGRKKARNRSTYKAVILLAKPLWRRALAALCEAPRRALSRADGGCGLPSPRPIAATKKPVAVPRSRAARADVPVIDGWLPRQRRLLNGVILQASSEAISWPSDSIAVGVYLHRLPGADPT